MTGHDMSDSKANPGLALWWANIYYSLHKQEETSKQAIAEKLCIYFLFIQLKQSYSATLELLANGSFAN